MLAGTGQDRAGWDSNRNGNGNILLSCNIKNNSRHKSIKQAVAILDQVLRTRKEFVDLPIDFTIGNLS